MPDYRYKYQLIQALDEKIGRDLRKIVECYLGRDPENTRADRHFMMYLIGSSGASPSRWLKWLREFKRQFPGLYQIFSK